MVPLFMIVAVVLTRVPVVVEAAAAASASMEIVVETPRRRLWRMGARMIRPQTWGGP